MLKVLIIGGLIAISVAATLYNDSTDDDTAEGCLYENELWGSEDGTKFYFCLPGTNITIEQSCSKNTFFVRNETTTGCVPLDLVNPNCIGSSTPVGSCTGENLLQPQPATSPTQFYLCTAENETPILLTCAEEKAFLKQDGYLGCFDWTQWRTLRNCPTSE